MDSAGFWRSQIEHILIEASWVPAAGQLTGIDRLSRVWNELPAWYFWIRDVHGAFRLGLEDAFEERAAGQDTSSGIFSIKFYPAPQSRLLADFSPEEQAYVQGKVFDPTFTPGFEAEKEIPESLFNTASMEVTFNPDRDWCLLSLDSVDLLRTTSVCDGQKSVMRQVSGWELGYALFDPLVSLHSLFLRQPPSRVVLLSSTGFECLISPDGSVTHVEADDLRRLNLLILFQLGGESAFGKGQSYVDTRLHELQERGSVVLENIGPNPVSPRPLYAGQICINPQWWTLSLDDLRSDQASPCSCSS